MIIRGSKREKPKHIDPCIQDDFQLFMQLTKQWESTKDLLTRTQYKTLYQKIHRLRKKIQNPTPRQRVVGNRKGFLTPDEQERVKRYQVLDAIKKKIWYL